MFEQLINYGLEYVSGNYKNSRSKITVKDNIGYLYCLSIDNIKHFKPSPFHTKNPYTISNIKIWLEKSCIPIKIISDLYLGSHKNLKWQCLNSKCDEVFEACWANIQTGYGCPYCAGKKAGKNNCLATKRPDLIIEWHPTKNSDLTPYNVTYGSEKYIWWKCLECGHEWKATPNNRTNINCNCPECNKPKGEKEVNKILCLYNIFFIPQKEFDGLLGLGDGNLSYDFYLPNYNLLIEYQGEQHEKYVPGLHKSKNKFKQQQEHDKRKKEYALKHNINLLEIWYYDFDNIEEILLKKLNIKAGDLSA